MMDYELQGKSNLLELEHKKDTGYLSDGYENSKKRSKSSYKKKIYKIIPNIFNGLWVSNINYTNNYHSTAVLLFWYYPV